MTQTLQANGIEIAYETFGDPEARPLVMVMGLNTQMIAWPDELCEDLAKAGHWVIRYDNRDIGESTHFRGVKAPPIAALISRRTRPPYTVADMGRDLLGVIDALGLESAHVVGASMGGYIAQAAAVEQPDRIRSLTLIMTSSGSRRLPAAPTCG